MLARSAKAMTTRLLIVILYVGAAVIISHMVSCFVKVKAHF